MAVQIDLNKCNGCATCETLCPMAVMIVKEKAQVIEEGCNECGDCIERCPQNAISLPVNSKTEDRVPCTC